MAAGVVAPGNPDGRKTRIKDLTKEMARQVAGELRTQADEIEALAQQIQGKSVPVDGASKAEQAIALLRRFNASIRASLADQTSLGWG